MPRKGNGELKKYVGLRVTQADKKFLQENFDNISEALRKIIHDLRKTKQAQTKKDGG